MKVNAASIRDELRSTMQQSQARCLYKAAKWAGENLIGMDDLIDAEDTVPTANSYIYLVNAAIAKPEQSISHAELNHILYAQALIANAEYQRASHYLLNSKDLATQDIKPKTKVQSSLGSFLAYYSLYMSGEKIRDHQIQESIALDSPAAAVSIPTPAVNASNTNPDNARNQTDGKEFAKNPFLPEIYQEMMILYNNSSSHFDSYLLYFFAVIVRDHNRQYGNLSSQMESMNTLLKPINTSLNLPSVLILFKRSIAENPVNWSCWLELAEYLIHEDMDIPPIEEFLDSRAPSEAIFETENTRSIYQIMYTFFSAHVFIERQNGSDALGALESLQSIFPKSSYITSQIALAQYTLRDYDQAQETFELVRHQDPYRLDNIDTYSNILYVKEMKAELSYLAHVLIKINRYSPECCCVIGNFYSLKGQHERAILYFSRALKLNATCLAAWTLLGHECVELRNTAAAVQCYQRAVRLNKLDYRAWYGLGQIYEMLHMFSYALYYYKKATAIRSNDSRMWCALGSCYQHLNYPQLAIQSYEYAVKYDEREGIATKELGRLYRELNMMDKATMCYLQYWIGQGCVEPETYHVTRLMTHNASLDIDNSLAEAILYVGNFFRTKGYLEHAEEYCSLLLDYVGPEGEEARAILRELRTLISTTSASQSVDLSNDRSLLSHGISNLETSFSSPLGRSLGQTMLDRSGLDQETSRQFLLSTSDDEIILRQPRQSQLRAFSMSPSNDDSSTVRYSQDRNNQSVSSVDTSMAMSISNSMGEDEEV